MNTRSPEPLLTCQELVELVTDYLERALPPQEAARFERHLAICPPCVRYVEQIRETISLAGRVQVEDIAPDERQRLLELFRGWRGR